MFTSGLANIFTSFWTNMFNSDLVNILTSDWANMFSSASTNYFTSSYVNMFTIDLATCSSLAGSTCSLVNKKNVKVEFGQ